MCSEQDCEGRTIARGLCRVHYGKAHYRKELVVRPKQPYDCIVVGCREAPHARGRCKKHYARWLARMKAAGSGEEPASLIGQS